MACVLCSWTTTAGASSTTYVKTWDDFNHGFSEVSTDGAAAKWFHFSALGFVGNDGIVTDHQGSIEVEAAGTHALTGEPAFTLSVAQEDQSFLPGGFDHVKWLVYSNSTASSGYPGFDAVAGRRLACHTVLSGRTYGVDNHPFGSNVTHPDGDFRLAAFAFNTIDFETYMVFDFLLTNDTIYAFYERLPFGRGPTLGTNYAAFSYAIPVAPYYADVPVALSISYDRAASEVEWRVNGLPVLQVPNVGARLPDRTYMTLDHGGEDTLVDVRQLACGMGLFTILDGALPGMAPLVRLSNAADFYFAPDVGHPTPVTFVDEQSETTSRLFGQGASLRVWHTLVSSLPTSWF